METVLLRSKQLLNLEPAHTEKSHLRVSIFYGIKVRFVQWLVKAPLPTIRKAFVRTGLIVLLTLAVFAPAFLAGFLTAVLKWNSFRVPIYAAMLVLLLRVRPLLRYVSRMSPGRSSNQHTFHGIPAGELAAYLKEAGTLKRDETMKTFGLTWGRFEKLATELEERQLLTRGENNARTLRPISLANLVRQLRDGFPLAWSDERECWYDRNGTFERWAVAQDFKQRKLSEAIERKERKLEKLDAQVQERTAHPLFASLAV